MAMAVASAANPTQVYLQPWNSSAGDSGAFSQADQLLAGEFSLATAAGVDQATWYGTMYVNSITLHTGDTWSFQLTFFDNASGLPGSMISSAAVLASVTDTGIAVDGERAYLFDASFPDVALSAGTPYWFSAENTGIPVTFRWTQATTGLASAILTSGNPWVPWTEEVRTPLNFALYDAAVPEPASLLLLGPGLIGLGWVRRSRQKAA